MGAKIYSDEKFKGGLLIEEDFVVCQVESLCRLQHCKKWDLVVSVRTEGVKNGDFFEIWGVLQGACFRTTMRQSCLGCILEVFGASAASLAPGPIYY